MAWRFQSATLNKTAITFSGEGDQFRMVVEVGIGRSGNLTGFNMRNLDPLPLQLSLHSLPCVVASKDHFTSCHKMPSNMERGSALPNSNRLSSRYVLLILQRQRAKEVRRCLSFRAS